MNLSANQVSDRLISRNAERAQKLKEVDSVREYNLDYTGFPRGLSAHMRVKSSYLSPGTKIFTVVSESGSRLLLNRVLHRLLQSEQEAISDAARREATMLSPANYRFALLGCAAGAPHGLYVMSVEPLRENKFLYRGTIWIDSQDFAVTHIEAEPAQNPSFWTLRSLIHHQYEKVGEFYLPALNQTVTDVRMGGKATLKIQYFDYKVSQQ